MPPFPSPLQKGTRKDTMSSQDKIFWKENKDGNVITNAPDGEYFNVPIEPYDLGGSPVNSLLVGRWFLADAAANMDEDLYVKYLSKGGIAETSQLTWGKPYQILEHNEGYLVFEADNGRIACVRSHEAWLLPNTFRPVLQK